MFNNLIESSSHKREFKRRGSFFLYTVAGYALLFAAAGVASIYAYDAHLDEQNLEITMLSFAPPEMSPAPALTVRRNPLPATDNGSHSAAPTARVVYEDPSDPHTTPDKVSTVGVNLPTPKGGFRIGPVDNNPLGGGGPGSSTGPGGTGGTPNTTVEVETPPPAAVVPTPVPKKIITSPKILNSVALSLPKPTYPLMAKQIHVSGSVNVQVLIDESGKVVSAHSVSGHPILAQAAVQSAYQARFSPTMIGSTPVKVSGIIVYNFVLQQ